MSRPILRSHRLVAVLVACLVALLAVPAAAAPGMPDPKQMSGIPRPDPQIPAGEITVRVLLGGFDEPALGAEVELELRSADGKQAELRRAEAGNQGRAHFRELGSFFGGQAVARVTLDGQTIRSQQIDVQPDTGTAVMLVKGAPKGDPMQEVSLPGIAFGLEKLARGIVVVGLLDLAVRDGIKGMPVHLDVTSADGTTETRTATSDDVGRVTFDGLDALPPGATLQVRAQLDPKGEPHRSMRFAVDPARGQAVVLARGRLPRGSGKAGHGGDAHAGGRQPLPPPRIARELPVGTAQLLLVDGQDQPLAEHPVSIVKKGFDGTEERLPLATDAHGVALWADLPVVEDALYYVAVIHDGAPWTSEFFGLDARGGVRVFMRVFEVTSDPSVVQSWVQWEIIEAENDDAQIVQVYRVLVSGEEAFWPDQELRIEGIEGAKGTVVLRGAEQWLDHDDDKAPYATLGHPIPPGEAAGLSIGYIVEHDGGIEIEWTPPFEVVDSAIIVADGWQVQAPGAKRSSHPVPEQPGLDYVRVAYELGQKGTGTVSVAVTGLRRTERIYAWLGLAFAAVLGAVLVLGLVLRPRGDTRARLVRRRDELLAALDERRSEGERRRLVAALDKIYRQLDALDAFGATPEPATATPTAAASRGQ
jgi:hypothetical protein